MLIDLHTHTSVSDGTETPAELVQAAAAAGIEVLGVCDHDTFAGLEAAAEAARQAGVRVWRGVEISAQYQGASVHLLGYGCRDDDVPLNQELARIRRGRTDRIPALLAKLAEAGMPIDDVLADFVADSPSVGRPHIADAMVAKGYVADRKEAFDRYLADDGPLFVPRYAVELEEGLALVRAAGGAAVLAHPWGRVSRGLLGREVLAALVAGPGLDGVEVDHQDHDRATRLELREVAGELGLCCTGSSDYHGTGKTGHELGCNTTAPAVLATLAGLVEQRGGRLTD